MLKRARQTTELNFEVKYVGKVDGRIEFRKLERLGLAE